MSFQPMMHSMLAFILNSIKGIILAGWLASNWWWIGLLVIALVVALVYLLLNGQRKTKTPEVDNTELEKMIEVLGGIDNIESISLEGSRLKVLLKNLKKCQYSTLKEHGAMGIFVSGKYIKFMLPKSASQLLNLIQAKKKEKIE